MPRTETSKVHPLNFIKIECPFLMVEARVSVYHQEMLNDKTTPTNGCAHGKDLHQPGYTPMRGSRGGTGGPDPPPPPHLKIRKI